MDRIARYFPELNESQLECFSRFALLFNEWNTKINLVSRKDIAFLVERHFLHSLAIARFHPFTPGTKVIDIGTGGGFPGLPLAIMFQQTSFTLVDSIAKKVSAVRTIAEQLQVENVRTMVCRAETLNDKYDIIVSRAVTLFPRFVQQFGQLLAGGNHSGILYLKGGELRKEMGEYFRHSTIYDLCEVFSEPFFYTKKLIYLPARYI